MSGTTSSFWMSGVGIDLVWVDLDIWLEVVRYGVGVVVVDTIIYTA